MFDILNLHEQAQKKKMKTKSKGKQEEHYLRKRKYNK